MAPTGRGQLTPATCPVAAYAADGPLSQWRLPPSATFGKADAGRGLPRATPTKLPSLPPGSGLIGREAVGAIEPHRFHATFGSGPQRLAPPSATANAVHAYADGTGANPRLPLKHVPAATMGTAPQRPAPLASTSNPVHAYAGGEGRLPKHTPQATFGTAPRLPERPSSGAARPHVYSDTGGGLPLKHTPHASFGSEARFKGVAHLGWRAGQAPLGAPMQPAVVAAA